MRPVEHFVRAEHFAAGAAAIATTGSYAPGTCLATLALAHAKLAEVGLRAEEMLDSAQYSVTQEHVEWRDALRSKTEVIRS